MINFRRFFRNLRFFLIYIMGSAPSSCRIATAFDKRLRDGFSKVRNSRNKTVVDEISGLELFRICYMGYSVA